MTAENDLKGIIKRIRSTIGGQFGHRSLKILGEKAAEIVRRRTRLGYGVRRNLAKRFRLSPLSPRYVEKRRHDRAMLSKFTRPGRSNLTLTGEMLDDLGPVKTRLKSVVLGFQSGSAREKAEHVSGRRPFLAMSKLEVKQLRRFKDKELSNALRKKGLK